jgi:pyruvate formate lyase activating enzyme
VRGLDLASFTAWEGRVAAVLSLQGCDFACPACTVPHLVPRKTEAGAIPVEYALESVYRRRQWLDAVVVAGGEPTLHEGLPDLVELLQAVDLPIRLRTNGAHPEVLTPLVVQGAVAGVAMTVRGPLDPTYSVAAGTNVRLARIYESIELLLQTPGEHEFRLPWLAGVVEDEQLESVVRMLAGARKVVLEPAADGSPGVRALRRLGREVGRYVESCVVAGRLGEDFGSAARGRKVAS